MRQLKLLSIIPLLGVLSLGGCGGAGSESSQEPDPVVIDIPIAYIRHALPEGGAAISEIDDYESPDQYRPGAELVIRDRASPTAEERVINELLFELAEVDLNDPDFLGVAIRDLNVSFDGRRLLFAARLQSMDDSLSWNIWEYDLDLDSLRRVIAADLIAEAGHDLAPAYLPDGRIVFSSDRQRGSRALLLDENKPQYSSRSETGGGLAFNLHTMELNGESIRQISFNTGHDYDPEVLADGRIVFSRWDQYGGGRRVSLYSVLPDGRALAPLYGYHSLEQTSQKEFIDEDYVYLDPQLLGDGRLRLHLQSDRGERFRRLPFDIDVENFVDVDRDLTGVDSGPAESQSFAMELALNGFSRDGYVAGSFALDDGSNRSLMLWSPCRLLDQNEETGDISLRGCETVELEGEENLEDRFELAPPLYGVWIYDHNDQSQLPVVSGVEGQAFSEVVALQQRTVPPVILDAIPGESVDAELFFANRAIVDIRSVYDIGGGDTAAPDLSTLANPALIGADERAFRFLRFEKYVSQPPQDVAEIPGSAFGRAGGTGMRQLLGYAEIHPDGSVRATVPAGVPFMLSIVDAQGRRQGQRHNNWMQVGAGEVRTCNGCHRARNKFAHGRSEAEPAPVNAGATGSGIPFAGANPELIPELDETMAQTRARLRGEVSLNPDLEFEDIWTDPAQRTPAASFAIRYRDLATPLPLSGACLQDWTANCRVNIQYPNHIQTLWDLERPVFSADGLNELANYRCTACHSPSDELGNARVPAAQLDLSGVSSTDEPDHLLSFRELLYGDNEQLLLEGALVDRLVNRLDGNGNPVFLTDADGELILDDAGLPIPVLDPVPLPAVLSASAASDERNRMALARFAAGGSHAGFLSAAELRLLREWLDLGGQYYNNPFLALP